MKEPLVEVSDGCWKNIIAMGVMICLILLGLGGCKYWCDKGEALRNEQRDGTNKP